MKALALPLRRPVGTAATYAALLLMALAALHSLPLALAPDLTVPQLIVQLSWPNATPETMEALVTTKVEAEAQRLRGVANVASVSGLGWAEVSVDFQRGTRMDRAEVFLRERLAALREQLPPALAPPVVSTSRTTQDDGGRFFVLRAGGPRTPESLRRVLEDTVAPRLAALPGVSAVQVYGGGERELHVDVDQRSVERGQVTPAGVAAAVAGVGGSRSLGSLRRGTQRMPLILVRPEPRAENLQVQPAAGDARRPIAVGEVARVMDGWRDPVRRARVNGDPAVQLVVEREPGTNVLRVARAVRTTLAALAGQMPGGVRIETLYDQSARIQEELAALVRRSSLSVFAVFVVLVLSAGRLRAPLAVLGSVLCSGLITFLLFRATGLGLNLVTLSGLALAFGMAVDSSIVLLQSIAQHVHGVRTVPRVVAAVRQVLLPLLAGTLTTAVVMVPFLYLTGDLRTYYLPFVLAVCLSLLASFFVGVTLTPLLARGALGRADVNRARAGAWVQRTARHLRLPSIERVYAPLLECVLRRPWVPLALAAAAFAGSLWVFQTQVGRGSLFASDPDTGIRIAVVLPRGAEVERTDALVQRFERHALEHPFRRRRYVEQVQAFVAENRGYVDVRFDPAVALTTVPATLQQELMAQAAVISGAEVSVSGYGPGFSSSRAQTTPSYRFTVRGPDYVRLGRFAEDLGRRLAREARVREIDTNAASFTVEAASDLALVPDREHLARLGLRMDDLVSGIQPAIAGEMGDRTLQGPEGDVPARIRYAGGQALTREQLLASFQPAGRGAAIPLSEVLRVDERPVLPEIRRDHQQYQRSVTFDYRGPRPVGNAFVRAFLRGTAVPPGYSLDDGLGIFLTRREERQLAVALGLAFLLVYMVAAALFESLRLPFVALLALPLGFVGITVAFWATRSSFDRAAYVGLILLAGIAINSALLLVHRAGGLLRRGLDRTAAIRRAARERCRPIVMTTATGVAGLLPLAWAGDAGTADTWRGLALAACSGLAAAAIATLTVVPALFLMLAPRRAARAAAPTGPAGGSSGSHTHTKEDLCDGFCAAS